MKCALSLMLFIIYPVYAQQAMFHAHNQINCALPAQPGSITGTTPVCQGNNGVAYSVTNVAGIIYTWAYSGTGYTQASGGTTNSITADFSAAATSGTLTCTPSNSCGNGTASSFAITVNPLPAQPGSITGTSPVCEGTNGVAYSVSNIAGVTYTWTYSGSGYTQASGGTSNSITANFSAAATSGTLTCTPGNSCGNGTARTFAITVNPKPAQPSVIAGSAYFCQSTSGVAYSVTIVAGVTYTWTYTGTGLTVASGQGTNAITVNFSATATAGILKVTPRLLSCNGPVRTLALSNSATYTSSGSFTVPACATNICIDAWGPGGLGANSTTTFGGGGGCGGGYSQGCITVTPGTDYTITIGSGFSGTSTSVSSLGIVANSGGTATVGQSGGAGGAGGIGSTANGLVGGNGTSGCGGTGGKGGGPGGGAGATGGCSSGSGGNFGNDPGGGGGGTICCGGGGGWGIHGEVIITW